MKRTILTLSLVFCCVLLMAQPRIRVDKGPDDKSIDFFLENKEHPGTLTVLMTFKSLSNTSINVGVLKYEIRHENERFLSLKPRDESQGIGYNYSYIYIYGQVDSKIDADFVYRMPCTTTRPVRVNKTVNAIDMHRNPTGEQKSLGFVFAMEKGDTVYAMRRGMVVKIEVPEKQVAGTRGVHYTSESTKITVEQPDGTNAWYICVDPEHLFVREGDEILPSMPLALSGSYDGEHYLVSVQIYSQSLTPDPGEKAKPGHFKIRHISPRFATSGGVLIPGQGNVYTPVCDNALVMREMTKKEQKKWLGSRSK